jgi:hypothetical protein
LPPPACFIRALGDAIASTLLAPSFTAPVPTDAPADVTDHLVSLDAEIKKL